MGCKKSNRSRMDSFRTELSNSRPSSVKSSRSGRNKEDPNASLRDNWEKIKNNQQYSKNKQDFSEQSSERSSSYDQELPQVVTTSPKKKRNTLFQFSNNSLRNF